MKSYLLAIDQGTTGTRAFLYTQVGGLAAAAYRETHQYFPKPGWVEHDSQELWGSTVSVIRRVLSQARVKPTAIAAIGITNQRETTILWDRKTGVPLHRAIVWQDRRTTDICQSLKKQERAVRRITGLVCDPYFSGTKITWLLRHSPAVAKAARQGRLAFGTVDSWLLWKLTGAKVHATDATNASRTLLFDLAQLTWSEAMLRMLGVPKGILPVVHPSCHSFGTTAGLSFLPAGIPIAGIAGDQQAALFGQGCTQPGMAKNTYGTGCFLLMQTGRKRIYSRHGLITTVACDSKGQPSYALEGSVFIAGAAIQWLRDGLSLIRSVAESEKLARSVTDTAGVHMVPAFVGLGAPYWRPEARGLISGLTRGVTRAHLVRAALESIAYQSLEVSQAMEKDSGIHLRSLRVDGGAVKNNLLLQLQADIAGVPVVRPRIIETTVLGAAQLAGLQVGFWTQKDCERMRGVERTFHPRWNAKQRQSALEGWQAAVRRALCA